MDVGLGRLKRWRLDGSPGNRGVWWFFDCKTPWRCLFSRAWRFKNRYIGCFDLGGQTPMRLNCLTTFAHSEHNVKVKKNQAIEYTAKIDHADDMSLTGARLR
jgi:hypothetical protein